MKLVGAPWRLEKYNGGVSVVTTDDFVIADFSTDPDELTNAVEDEESVARAITALPALLSQIGAIIEADEKNDQEAFNGAVDSLLAEYRKVLAP